MPSLLIYLFATLTMVAIYGNYLLIFLGGITLTDMLYRSISASVGNMIAEGNHKLIKRTFWRILTYRLVIANIFCTGVFILSESFVTLWIGSEYVMSEFSLVILILINFIQMSRTCGMFLSAYGLFKDIWAPIAQSLMSVILAIILGYLLGLAGILLGFLVGQLVIENSWKPIFLYREGFKESIKEYAGLYTIKIVILLISSVLTYFVFSYFILIDVEGFIDWIFKALLVVVLNLSFSITLLSLADKSALDAFETAFKYFKKRYFVH